MDCYYDCTKVEIKQKIGRVYEYDLFLTNLQFVNENRHDLALTENVLVALENGHAKIVYGAEDLFPAPEAEDDETWLHYVKLCDKHPAPEWRVYEEEKFGQLVSAAAK